MPENAIVKTSIAEQIAVQLRTAIVTRMDELLDYLLQKLEPASACRA